MEHNPIGKIMAELEAETPTLESTLIQPAIPLPSTPPPTDSGEFVVLVDEQMAKRHYPYRYVPHRGSVFEKNGKRVFCNLANHGWNPRRIMSQSRNGSRQKPLEARKIKTPGGPVTFVTWEAKPQPARSFLVFLLDFPEYLLRLFRR